MKDMKEYKFEDKKLYKFEGGCLYVIKRKKRSLRGVLMLKGTEIHLADQTLEITNHTDIELDFRIETAMMLKPERYDAEYVKVMGHTICSYCITEKYKCPLLFSFVSLYRLKEMKAAGVEIGEVLMDVVDI